MVADLYFFLPVLLHLAKRSIYLLCCPKRIHNFPDLFLPVRNAHNDRIFSSFSWCKADFIKTDTTYGLFPLCPVSSSFASSIFPYLLRICITAAFTDKIFRHRIKPTRFLPVRAGCTYKINQLIFPMSTFVKRQCRADVDTVIRRPNSMQQRCHVPVVTNIVRASAKNRHCRHRRQCQCFTSRIAQRNPHNLRRMFQRHKRRHFCFQRMPHRFSCHRMPHQSCAQHTCILFICKFSALLLCGCPNGRPAAAIRHPAPKISAGTVIMQIFHTDWLH